jgi:ABC-type phosphate/phosphonate transport system substrate-binding protein
LAEALRVLAPTPPTPAIPFVTSAATPLPARTALRTALRRVSCAPEHEAARAGLMLKGVSDASTVDYRVQIRCADEAAALGYPVLS